MEKPNGLAFSPDFKTLYVSDTGASHKDGHPRQIHAFDVSTNNELSGHRVFCDLGPAMPDGFRLTFMETFGLVPVGQDRSMMAYRFLLRTAPRSEQYLPEGVSNLCFGGIKRNRLFITGGQSIFSLYVAVQGMPYF